MTKRNDILKIIKEEAQKNASIVAQFCIEVADKDVDDKYLKSKVEMLKNTPYYQSVKDFIGK